MLRGVALDTGAVSYLERVQEVAEMESRLKMQKLERDMPKYLRAQRTYVEQFERLSKELTGEEASALGMSTDEFLG